MRFPRATHQIVVWTRSGYFDATYEGAAQVHLRFAGLPDLYTFDQFANTMRRPGLADLVMRGVFKDEPIIYRIPPTLTGAIRADGENIIVTMQQVSGKRLNRILIYQDGLHTDDLAPMNDGSAHAATVRRLAGVQWVSAVAIDEDGLVSKPLMVDLGAAPSKRSLRILGVGVDEYSAQALPKLSYAKSDVTRVINAIKGSKSQIYAYVDSVTLTDAVATRSAILDALKRFVGDESGNSDIILVFAGHGVKGSDGKYYLALSQTDITDLQSTALSWDEIAQILSPTKARVTVILDSCHSGDASRGMLSTNDDVVKGLLARVANVTILAGSKGREYSLESPDVGGGYFSAAIAEAYASTGHQSDINRNGVLEASEMYAAVKQYVTTRTKGMQTPWIARNKMIGDFALF